MTISFTKKIVELHQYFKEFRLIYQYVYSLYFFKYVGFNKRYLVQNRSKLMLCYKEWVDSRKDPSAAEELAKQPEN